MIVHMCLVGQCFSHWTHKGHWKSAMREVEDFLNLKKKSSWKGEKGLQRSRKFSDN